MKQSKFSMRLRRALWYLAISALILLALLLSVARLLLPELQGYRQQLAEWASEAVGQPVTVGAIDARLSGLSPAVILRDVALLDNAGEAVLNVRELQLVLDPLASLVSRQPVLDTLVVVGTELTVIRDEQGLHIKGLSHPVNTAEPVVGGEELPAGRAGDWLLSQGQLAIRDSSLVWNDRLLQQRHRFTGVTLSLQNDGDHHSLLGEVQIPEALGRLLRVGMDIEGNPLHPQQWQGELYLRTEALRFKALDGIVPQLALQQGELNSELWGHWAEGRLQNLEGLVNIKGLRMRSEAERALRLDTLLGRFLWQRSDSGWQLAIDDFSITRGGKTWPRARAFINHGAGETSMAASFLRLDDLVAIARPLPLPEQAGLWLERLQPGGDLSDLTVRYASDGLVIQSRLQNVHSQSWEKIPGLQGLSGRLAATDKAAELVLESRNLRLDYPWLMRNPIGAEQFTGRLLAQTHGSGWLLRGEQLALGNADIDLQLDFDLQLPGEEAPPVLDLRGAFHDARVERVPDYLPVRYMKEGAMAWLDSAFKGGRAEAGTILINGPLVKGQFPYRDNEGRFLVHFAAKDVDLHFFPGWPQLTGVQGLVDFDNAGLRVRAREGRLLDVPLTDVAVAIDDFREGRLTVATEEKLDAADALKLLRDTPLRNFVGTALDSFSAQGQTELQLRLDIPINQRGREKGPLRARGSVAFADAQVSPFEGLSLKKLNGTLAFDNRDFSAEAIRGELFGKPVTLQVVTEITGDSSSTAVIASGRLSAESLARAWPEQRWLAQLEGQTAWRGRLQISGAEAQGSRIRISSNLDGLASHLPEPLGKPAETAMPLLANYHFSGATPGLIEAALGEQVTFSARYGEPGLSLHFGRDEAPVAAAGEILVSGTLERFEPVLWYDLWRDAGATEEEEATEAAAEPVTVRVQMERLGIWGPDQASDSEPGQALTEEAGGEPPVAALPPFQQLSVEVGDLSYNDMSFGALTLHAGQEGNRMAIDSLQLDAPTHSLTGSGQWDASSDETSLQLQLQVRNAGNMLSRLGFASVLSGGKGNAQAELSWPGMPTAFDLQALSGTLRLKLEEGEISDIDPGAGRLLGLFSLRALPRRIALDFSDVDGGGGMSYDKLVGRLRINGGQMYSDKLEITSPAAEITITGRTGLVSRDFDQLVTVIPNITDTVSVAGGLALGPQAALALLVLQEAVKSDINKGAQLQYTITGSWDAPVVTEIEGADSAAEEDVLDIFNEF